MYVIYSFQDRIGLHIYNSRLCAIWESDGKTAFVSLDSQTPFNDKYYTECAVVLAQMLSVYTDNDRIITSAQTQ